MQTVALDAEEWQRVLAIIASAPWNVANPLLMKIGQQLQAQQTGNSKMQETAAAEAQLESKAAH